MKFANTITSYLPRCENKHTIVLRVSLFAGHPKSFFGYIVVIIPKLLIFFPQLLPKIVI